MELLRARAEGYGGREAWEGGYVSVFCGLEENYLIIVYYYALRFIIFISEHPRRSDCADREGVAGLRTVD